MSKPICIKCDKRMVYTTPKGNRTSVLRGNMKIVTIIHYGREIVMPNDDGKLLDQLIAMIQNSDFASIATTDQEGEKIIIPREAALNSIIFERDE